jgi:hypothetical protein
MTLGTGDPQRAYRAGACNIGPEEVAKRRRLGIAEVALAILLAAGLVIAGTPAWTRIALWPILAGAFVTLEQVRRRFCVAFGFAGVHDLGLLGRPERVEDAAARDIDRRAAFVLSAYCSLAAAFVTALFVAVAG